MAKPRKPTPKTQKQISVSKQKAFEGIEDQGILTNPNSADGHENANYQDTGISYNRSEEMSFKGDKTKQYSVGIQDLDEAVFYYFQNVIKPFVIQNGTRREVPVIYGAPERWKSFQRDGYYRDKSDAIMLPIIVIKRDTITKDRSVANKLDSNQPNLYGTWSKSYGASNFYDNFSLLNNRKPVESYHVVAQPDYVTLEYSCLIQTYYMSQLNKIIEACEYASDSYWGNPERYKFRAFIDSFATATELIMGQDRLVKGTFNIRLRGYIIPDVIQKDLNAMKKYNSKAKVTITTEAVRDMRDTSPLRNPTTDGRIRD
jgi:hypothetical protein|tara:strand:+ start:5200 stop:6144 length:945 start_codon:yes stop_codon:yes gene_type:complete